ncbi:MAG: hypothetical protein AAF602_13545 [Myxococcota bacterium]
MIVVFTSLAAAAPDPSGLRDTATTLGAGEVVVRLPTGRSAVGLGERTEVWVTPIDAGLGGTRIGMEQRLLDRGAVAWSVTPSVGQKWSGGRTSVRLATTVSTTWRQSRVNLTVAPELGWLREVALGEARSSTFGPSRLHVPVEVAYDHLFERAIVRGTVRAWTLDEGEPLTYGVTTLSWIHQWGRVFTELGAGLLVGRPSEHHFLGRYQTTLVVPYPRLDLWLQLGRPANGRSDR